LKIEVDLELSPNQH